MSQFEGMLVSVARKPTAPPPPTAGKRGRDQVDSALDRILLDDDALDQGGDGANDGKRRRHKKSSKKDSKKSKKGSKSSKSKKKKSSSSSKKKKKKKKHSSKKKKHRSDSSSSGSDSDSDSSSSSDGPSSSSRKRGRTDGLWLGCPALHQRPAGVTAEGAGGFETHPAIAQAAAPPRCVCCIVWRVCACVCVCAVGERVLAGWCWVGSALPLVVPGIQGNAMVWSDRALLSLASALLPLSCIPRISLSSRSSSLHTLSL